MARSETIRGRIVAITVRSTAPTKTASSAAASEPRADRDSPAQAPVAAGVAGARGSDRRLNLDLLVLVRQVERPRRRVVTPRRRRLGELRPQQVVVLLVDPEVNGHRRADHRV